MKSYFDALKKEIHCKSELYSKKYNVDTVFIGGGTPSLVDSKHMEGILQWIFDGFNISDDAEITTEGNPNTLTKEKLRSYVDFGINRISMGVQTLDEKLLKLLGRLHTKQDFFRAYSDAVAAGFENINMDLMFSLPGQTDDLLMSTLVQAVELSPAHISFYSLQLEEGTQFFREYSDGNLQIPDDIDDRRMYHKGIDFLKKNGYLRYEISNFSKIGKECRHNLKYWSMDEYLGIGLGAHSYIDGFRMENISDFPQYIDIEVEKNFLNHVHKNSLKENIEEYMITALRKIDGFDIGDFERRFGVTCLEVYPDIIEHLLDKRFMIIDKNRMRLSDYGIDISNKILCEFL